LIAKAIGRGLNKEGARKTWEQFSANDLAIRTPRELRDGASALGLVKYDSDTILTVALEYPKAKTRADKELLAGGLGLSLVELYNLAAIIKDGGQSKVLSEALLEDQSLVVTRPGHRSRPSGLAERLMLDSAALS
jgi:hypothetical protein